MKNSSVSDGGPRVAVDASRGAALSSHALSHRALVLAGLVGLALAATRRPAAAACLSTCTEQLVECKRTCPGGGQGRHDCRTACAERSTCTAPGARIRTLAYVVNECNTDPQGKSSGLKQKIQLGRANV